MKYVDPTAKDDVPEGPQPKDIQLPVREVKKPEDNHNLRSCNQNLNFFFFLKRKEKKTY